MSVCSDPLLELLFRCLSLFVLSICGVTISERPLYCMSFLMTGIAVKGSMIQIGGDDEEEQGTRR